MATSHRQALGFKYNSTRSSVGVGRLSTLDLQTNSLFVQCGRQGNYRKTSEGVVAETKIFSTKESREGSWSTIQKISFSSPKSICAAYAIEEYLRRTEEFRDNVEGDNNLFLSLDGLHSLSSQSIAKLCKSMMDNARIPSRFTAGSIRHAAACAAIDAGVPVDEVLKIGRWRSREVFEKYYWIATRGSTNIIKAVNSNIQR